MNKTGYSLPADNVCRESSALCAAVVPEHERQDFWRRHFGTVPQWLFLELNILSWFSRLCHEYHGGYWHFYTLSNGGVFMAPDGNERYALYCRSNGNRTTLGAEAAGITACLMMYSHMSFITASSDMAEHYYRLRDYALCHPESQGILTLTD
ncbi:antirestriction protein [Dickeya zeae]|uniref:antirestriction protein n=1 Tax=Dickeya zeae TaxID=204042 RepID=UPI001F38C632|nr:antirestriction protein [Dickeya zeae]UJR63003.1 antirestriction protein [Dickeya zeae]